MMVVPVAGEIWIEAIPAEPDLITVLRTRIGCDWVAVTDVTVDGHAVAVWYDEEAALSAAPQVNLRASRILASAGVPQPILLGPAVLTGGPDSDGTTTGLTGAVACHIADVVAAKSASPDCLPPPT